ncbi:hypothetical protein FJZ53_02075 [Candidatus Woesearchaeota archaeon]|nr:hypothetical protein [Candidatus Woesearchaeota archaeon]
MKIPRTFIPEKDLTKEVSEYLKDKPTSLYDHVSSVYEGSGQNNIFLLYGPPGSGKTSTSTKTKETLSGNYDLSHIVLQPTDPFSIETGREYFRGINMKIAKALASNKKVYIDIMHIEKFKKLAQEALDAILIKYKKNKEVVFVIESYHKHNWSSSVISFQDNTVKGIEFTKE